MGRDRLLCTAMLMGCASAAPLSGQSTPLDSALALTQRAAAIYDHRTPAARDSARQIWRQALPKSQRARNNLLTGILHGFLARSFLANGPLDSVPAHSEASLALLRSEGDTLNLLTALLDYTTYFQRRGPVPRALSTAREALTVARWDPDPVHAGRAHEALGHVFLFRQNDSARAHLEQARDSYQRTSNPQGRAGYARALATLGALVEREGDLPRAFAGDSLALAVAREQGDSITTLLALREIGRLHHRSGELRKARADLEYARLLADSFANSSNEAMILEWIGALLLDFNRPKEAQAAIEEALSLYRADGEAAMAAGAYVTLAELLLQRDSVAAAREMLARAEVAFDSTEQGAGAEIANLRGRLDMIDGRLESARTAFELSLSLAEANADSAMVATVMANLGDLFSASEPARALGHYHRALRIARRFRNPRWQAEILADIGRLYHKRGGSLDLQSAIAYYDSASSMLNRIRGRVDTDADRLSVGDIQADLFGAWTLAELARIGEVGADRAALNALGVVERSRARALRDMMWRGPDGAGPADTVPGIGLAARVDTLLAAPRGDRVAVLSYLLTPDTILIWLALPSGTVRVARRAVTRARADSVVAAVRSVVWAAAPADVDRRGGGVPTGLLEELQPVWLSAVGDSLLRRENWEEVLSRASELLLPAELLRDVSPGTELLILPHGSLWAVPFAALPVGPRGEALGLLHPVRYSPSLATLALARSRRSQEAALRGRKARQALVAGNPEMPLDPSVVDGAEYFDALPHSQVEAFSVASLLGTRPLVGGAATETEIRRRLPSAEVVHLATHGVAYSSEIRARESLIALTPDAHSGGTPGDGYLTAGEILDDSSLTLAAELVALSACQTGLGNLRETEGTVGLQRAFLAKGARAVLVSLWQVPDSATGELMSRFYGHWLHPTHPVTKAEALRLAQGEVKSLPGYSHPYYWAGFQLVGAR